MSMLRRTFLALALTLASIAVATAAAQEMGDTMTGTARVTLFNHSPQPISPPVLVAHDGAYAPFAVGEPAPPELVPLAEEGDASELVVVARVAAGVRAVVAADAPLAPGASLTLDVPVSDDAPYLTVLGMLVTSNDAFVAWSGDVRQLVASGGMAGEAAMGDASMAGDEMAGDEMAGESMGMGMAASGPPADGVARVYDAGSEANTESCAHVPGPPCGGAGGRAPDGAEGHVALHGGILGVGDLDPANWDWTNPVLGVSAE